MHPKVPRYALIISTLACVPFVPRAMRAITSQSTAAQESSATEEGASTPDSTGPLPGEGGCAKYDIDNYKPADSDTCHLRMYACHHQDKPISPNDRNTGDISWALTRNCGEYGAYLHVWRVDVAKAMVDMKGLYKQCNWGVCGCPPPKQMCDDMKAKGLETFNSFGWRATKYIKGSRETCPCYQFSLPKRASGTVNNTEAAAFVADKGYKKQEEEGDFQWKYKLYERTVPIAPCFSKYINVHDTIEAKIAAFQEHVLSHKPSPECDAKQWLKLHPPSREIAETV